MDEAETFRRNAEQADRRAGQAKTEHDREAYLKIAAGWRALLARAEFRHKRGF